MTISRKYHPIIANTRKSFSKNKKPDHHFQRKPEAVVRRCYVKNLFLKEATKL